MKIVFVLTRFVVGGSENYVKEKANWFKKNRGTDCLIISSGGSNVSSLNGLTNHVTILNIDKSPALISASAVRLVQIELINAIKSFGATHIECYELNPAKYIFAILGKLDARTIVNMMTLSELGFKKDFALQVVAKYFESITSLYTLNRGMSEHINSATLISLRFKFLNIPIRLDSRTIDVSNCTSSYILSVSRLSYDKEYVLALVDSFGRVSDRLKETELIIIGDGPYREKIEEKISHLDYSVSNRIKVLGSQSLETTENYIRNCSVFVGMGTSLLLAAKYNKFCLVASPISGWRNGTIGIYSKEMSGSFGQLYSGAKLEQFDVQLIRFFLEKDIDLPSSYAALEKYHDYEKIFSSWYSIYVAGIGRQKVYYFYLVLFNIYILAHRVFRATFR